MAPALWLRRLKARQFRSYESLQLELEARPVVLTGVNGAGKTNLLEAVSLLTPGRGLRGARLADLDRRHAGAAEPSGPWALAAEVVTDEGIREIATGREPAGAEGGEGGERRRTTLDGLRIRSQQDLAEVVSAVWLTPAMDGLFRDGPGDRRRFLDRLILSFDPAHAGRSAAYERSLRERARLLRERRGDDAWLTSLEDSMARHGIAIAASRQAMVRQLAEAAVACGPFPAVGLEMTGEIESWLAEGAAVEAEDRMRSRLAAARAEDAQSGGAAAGPHRSDLRVRHLETGRPAAVCSTGEQKALLIAMVLANGRLLALEKGAAPLLLLDEVAAHLDAGRRAALFAELQRIGAQVWMTGTEPGVFAGLGAAQLFRVADGRVLRLC